MGKINFKEYNEHCIHRGMVKEGKWWCGFKGGVPAKCWSDWQLCCENNCHLLNKDKKPVGVDNMVQISLEEFMGEKYE